MHVFLILAAVGSAVAAPQFAVPRTTFDPTVTNFAPAVTNFGAPIAQVPRFAAPTNSFAPTVTQFAAPVATAPRFATPTTSFNPQLTNFGTPAVAGRGNSVYNLDSPAFLPTAGGFDQTRQQPQNTLVERTQYQNDNSEYGNRLVCSSFCNLSKIHDSVTISLFLKRTA